MSSGHLSLATQQVALKANLQTMQERIEMCHLMNTLALVITNLSNQNL